MPADRELKNHVFLNDKQSDYGKVILPMTVLRRLDSVLAPKKQKVLDYLPKVEKLSDSAKDLALNKIAGHCLERVTAVYGPGRQRGKQYPPVDH